MRYVIQTMTYVSQKSVGSLELFSDHGSKVFVIEELLKSHLT